MGDQIGIGDPVEVIFPEMTEDGDVVNRLIPATVCAVGRDGEIGVAYADGTRAMLLSYHWQRPQSLKRLADQCLRRHGKSL